MKKLVFSACLFLFSVVYCAGQIVITSVTQVYSENFNTLKTSKTSTLLPAGWKIHEKGNNANTSYAADDGSSFTGNTYSYGKANSNDRALGMLNSNSLVSKIGVRFKNATGKTLNALTVNYTGEQWRCGEPGRKDRLDFQYSLDATSLSSGKWTDFNPLDFSSPSDKTKGLMDGNAVANRTEKSATINGLNIPDNGTFWFRWVDSDASGFNDGLAIDDFSLKVISGNQK
jgi:hypothetical protein